MRTRNAVTARKALIEGTAVDFRLHGDWNPVVVIWAFGNHEALGYLQEGVCDSSRKICVIIFGLWRRLVAGHPYLNVGWSKKTRLHGPSTV